MGRSLMNHLINLRLEENSLLKDALLERSFASAAPGWTQKKKEKKKQHQRLLLNGPGCRSSFFSLPVK